MGLESFWYFVVKPMHFWWQQAVCREFCSSCSSQGQWSRGRRESTCLVILKEKVADPCNYHSLCGLNIKHSKHSGRPESACSHYSASPHCPPRPPSCLQTAIWVSNTIRLTEELTCSKGGRRSMLVEVVIFPILEKTGSQRGSSYWFNFLCNWDRCSLSISPWLFPLIFYFKCI